MQSLSCSCDCTVLDRDCSFVFVLLESVGAASLIPVIDDVTAEKGTSKNSEVYR